MAFDRDPTVFWLGVMGVCSVLALGFVIVYVVIKTVTC